MQDAAAKFIKFFNEGNVIDGDEMPLLAEVAGVFENCLNESQNFIYRTQKIKDDDDQEPFYLVKCSVKLSECLSVYAIEKDRNRARQIIATELQSALEENPEFFNADFKFTDDSSSSDDQETGKKRKRTNEPMDTNF